MTTEAGGDYFEIMSRLARARMDYDADCRAVRQQYTERVRASASGVDSAVAEVTAASEGLRAARLLVSQADDDAHTVWHQVLSQAPARVAARLGPIPRPEVLDPQTELANGPASSVARLLSDAGDLADRLRVGRQPTMVDYAALVALGAVGAVCGVLASQAFLAGHDHVDGSVKILLFILSRVVGILSPLVGLAGIGWLLDHRAIQFGRATIPVVLVSGIVTSTAAIFLFPSSS